MTPLRLLHILPRCAGGGAERLLLRTVGSWRAAGHSVEQRAFVLQAPISRSLFLDARRSGMRIEMAPDEAVVQAAMTDADVVVVHWWNSPVLATWIDGFDWPATRVVLWSHVVGTAVPQLLTRDALAIADGLIAPCQATVDLTSVRDAVAEGLLVRRVTVTADPLVVNARRAQSTDVVVGYVGTVSTTKLHPGFADLCAAVTSPAVRFDVYGSGDETGTVAEACQEAGLGDRIAFHGFTRSVADALASMDIFGYPLCEDTYASGEAALQEAMHAGVPPVIFPHGGAADLVQHGETGLVATTPAEYSAAIDLLAGDPALRRRLGRNAADHARSAFDPTYWADQALDALRSVADVPRRKRAPLGVTDQPVDRVRRAYGGADLQELADNATPLMAHGEGGLAHMASFYAADETLQRLAHDAKRAAARDRRNAS